MLDMRMKMAKFPHLSIKRKKQIISNSNLINIYYVIVSFLFMHMFEDMYRKIILNCSKKLILPVSLKWSQQTVD